MAANKKTSFKDKIKSQVEHHKEQQSKGFGYLNLSKKDNDFYSIDMPKKTDTLKVQFDIIPYVVTDPKHPDRELGAEVGELWYRRPIKVHKHIGIDDETVICLTTFGKKCPVCEYQKELQQRKADKDDIKALNVSYRSVFNIVPKNDKDYEETPHIFDVSDFCFFDPLMVDVEELNEYNFPALEDGKTLSVRFKKTTGNGFTFPKAERVSFLKRKEQYDESILDDVVCLDECEGLLEEGLVIHVRPF